MDVCHAGFLSILKSIGENGIQPHVWTFLAVLFGDELTHAAQEILAKKSISLIIAKQSRRSLWVVLSKKRSNYLWIQPNRFICTCPSFVFSTMNRGQTPFCKHVLACFICKSLNSDDQDNLPYKILEIDDNLFSKQIEKVTWDQNE